MKAIILAAGRGSRMGGLTADQPKCMTILGGKPLVQWQLEALHGGGIDEVAIVRGYLGETFRLPVHYFDNRRWAQTNMVMSLAEARPWLQQGPCLVSYSDIVYGQDSVARLVATAGDIVITYDPHWRRLWELRFDDPLKDAETFRIDATGRLLEIGRRATRIEEIEGQYMGLLRFTPVGWQAVEACLAELPGELADRLDMTSLLQRLLDRGVPIMTTAIDEPWFEVDSESDLRLYQERFF
jgi:choline kinase